MRNVFLLILLVLVPACQQATPARPWSRMTSDDAVLSAVLASLKDQREIDAHFHELLRQALTAGDEEAHTAAVLAAARGSNSQLVATINAVDRAMAICTDNMANARTVGYRAMRAGFDGKGQLVLRRDETQGAVVQTKSGLDLAIHGEGFFAIKSKDGKANCYTRNGAFEINQNGRLVSSSGGLELDPPVSFPADCTSVTITNDGRVFCGLPRQVQPVTIAQIQLACFAVSAHLASTDGVLFTAGADSGETIRANPGTPGMGTVQQSFLESSNVDPIFELVTIVQLRRWRDTLAAAITLGTGPSAARDAR